MNKLRIIRLFSSGTSCVLLFLLATVALTFDWYGRFQGKETDDSYIDFVAKLNEMQSAGVDPDRNIAPGLLRLVGPKESSEKQWRWRWSVLYPKQDIPKAPFFKEAEELNEPLEFDTVKELTRTFWTEEEFPAAAQWINENAKQLDLLATLLETKDQYYMPVGNGEADQSVISCKLPVLMRIRELSKFVAVKAMNHFARDEFEEGLNEIHRLHQLGRLIGDRGFLIQLMIGIDICDIASRAEWELVVSGSPPKDVLLAYLNKKKQLGEIPRVSKSVEIAQMMNLDCVQLLKKEKWDMWKGLVVIAAKGTFDTEPAFDEVNKIYDSVSSTLTNHHDNYSAATNSIRALEKELQNTLDMSDDERVRLATESIETRSRLLGKLAIAHLFPAFFDLYVAETRSNVWARLSELAFHLEVHRLDTGSYPKQLNDLELEDGRKFLTVDPFSGDQTLRYQETDAGYRLYSVSNDQEDNGGENLNSQPGQKFDIKAADLGFEIKK